MVQREIKYLQDIIQCISDINHLPLLEAESQNLIEQLTKQPKNI